MEDEIVYPPLSTNPDIGYQPTGMTGNAVNHPAHYNHGKIEVIDAIEDWELNFSRGSAVKYVARAGRKSKETEIQDLNKALWCIQREIDRLTNA